MSRATVRLLAAQTRRSPHQVFESRPQLERVLRSERLQRAGAASDGTPVVGVHRARTVSSASSAATSPGDGAKDGRFRHAVAAQAIGAMRAARIFTRTSRPTRLLWQRAGRHPCESGRSARLRPGAGRSRSQTARDHAGNIFCTTSAPSAHVDEHATLGRARQP
jgi:hypothetical protein